MHPRPEGVRPAARNKGHHQLAGGSTRRRVRAETHDQMDRKRDSPQVAASTSEGKRGLPHPAGGAAKGRPALRALRNPFGYGGSWADRCDSGAGLPMNVVYVVYVVRTGFKPLSQEKQGLKQLGNPPIPLLRSRSQRSQRTQCSSVNTPCGAVARTPLAGGVGPMTLAGLA